MLVGVPNEIVYDNDLQLIEEKFTKFFEAWKIKRITLSPYYPGVNGQEESSNQVLLSNLRI